METQDENTQGICSSGESRQQTVCSVLWRQKSQISTSICVVRYHRPCKREKICLIIWANCLLKRKSPEPVPLPNPHRISHNKKQLWKEQWSPETQPNTEPQMCFLNLCFMKHWNSCPRQAHLCSDAAPRTSRTGKYVFIIASVAIFCRYIRLEKLCLLLGTPCGCNNRCETQNMFWFSKRNGD